MFVCYDLHETFPDVPPCCNSCHIDWEEYDYDASFVTVDGIDLEACCTVLAWIEENMEKVRKWMETTLEKP